MRSVIQKVLQTEDEARRLVESARADAETAVSQARAQARELLAQARHAARTEAESMVQAAVAEAEREKQAQLARAAEELKTRFHLDEPTTRRAAAAVVACVCGRNPSPQRGAHATTQ